MSTSLSRRGAFRAVLTCGAVVAVAFLPGTAAAADAPIPTSPPVVPEAVEDGLEDEATQATVTDDEQPPPPAAPAAAEGDAEEDPPPALIAELRAQVQALRDQFPENDCVDGVAAALENLVTTIADPEAFEDYQEELAEYLAGLPDVLGSLGPGEEPPPPPPFPAGPTPEEFEAAVRALAAALQACIPAPPTEQPEPPAEEPQPVKPVAQPPAPAQQPVSYPGYAPTGAEPADDGNGLAPAAMAGATLLVGGLAAARSRRRSG